MSKQLTISSVIAVLSMALFAMAMTLGHTPAIDGHETGTPLIGMTAGR